jgi:hypothetical protein
MRALIFASALGLATAAQAQPSHYDLKAHIDPKTGKLNAHLVITLQPQDLTPETGFLLGERFKLSHMDAGGGAKVTVAPAEVAVLKHVQRITVKLPGQPTRPVRLTLDYSGPLGEADDKDSVAFRAPDLMELRLEDMWLPARDNLTMVYSADADITGVPADKVAVAQGQVTHVGDRLRIHRPMVDFDLPITAATGLKEFKREDAEVYARDFDNMLVRSFKKHSVLAVEFEQDLLGPLPGGGPFRIVVSPRQKGGAYARKAFINSSDARDEMKDLKSEDDIGPVSVVAHEFGHAWWWAANPLTDNYWLAESMAEYTSMRYIEHQFGVAKRDELLARKRERAKDAGPILAGKRPTKLALYQKGPVLLFELDATIGREKMDRLLRILAQNPPHVTGDFLGALTQVAGADVAREFEAKLRAS